MTDFPVDDAGISAAAKTGIHIYEQASRGSGRTHRMIMSLPENSVAFCFNNTDWLRNMIRRVRGHDFKVKVYSATTWDTLYRTIGNNRVIPGRDHIVLDHHLTSQLYLECIEDARRSLQGLGVGAYHHGDLPPPVTEFFRIRE